MADISWETSSNVVFDDLVVQLEIEGKIPFRFSYEESKRFTPDLADIGFAADSWLCYGSPSFSGMPSQHLKGIRRS